MNPEQLGWLEGELRKSAAQWKIAFFHHPLYSSCLKHGSDFHLRACLEPLFVKYGMNVVFSGHDHVYERLKPSQGVYYFVTGAAGQLRKGNINRDDPAFAAGNDSMNSFVYATVNRERLVVEAIGLDGERLDEAVIPSQSTFAR
jgi:3',5'-cyclic AMP phosphodiesterase CpdA